MNRTTRKTNKTKIEDLRPYAKVVWGDEGDITVEDNFPDTYEGRVTLASILYGAFQAVSNDAQSRAPKIEIPTPETVSKLAIARS